MFKMKYIVLIIYLLVATFSYGQSNMGKKRWEGLFCDSAAHKLWEDRSQVRDTIKLVSLYKQASEQGCIHAMSDYGSLLLSGCKGLVKDKEAGWKWKEKAAGEGDVEAQFWLGRECCISRNYAEAVKWFKMAEDNKGILLWQSWFRQNAIDFLAFCYFKGLGISQSYTEALKLSNEVLSSNLNNPLPLICSYYILAECYYEGLGVEKDYNKAFNISIEALNSDMGGHNFEIHMILSKCYRFGRGTQVDIEAADYHYIIGNRKYKGRRDDIIDFYFESASD